MSKLNPQNATAYVGPGVLRKGGKITPVPNGPLIKKKGPFKGSILKAGGKIKKAQVGITLDTLYTKKSKIGNVRTNDYIGRMPSGSIEIGKETKTSTNGKTSTSKKASQSGILGMKYTDDQIRASMNKKKDGGKVKKAFFGSSMFKDNAIYKKTTDLRGKIGSSALGIPGMKPIVKNGKMIKRKDGSTSRRGLWDNIRANKGSGKKPTAAMLKQEKKIKAKK
jgi:hypothetical protein